VDRLARSLALLGSIYLKAFGFDLLDPETVGLADLHHQEVGEEGQHPLLEEERRPVDP
jgi:hypothetical protein